MRTKDHAFRMSLPSLWNQQFFDRNLKHPAMARGVKNLKARSNPQTTFFCLSNANSVFISTILEVISCLSLSHTTVTN